MSALAASFVHQGDATSLLARFGAISTMRGLRYWSVTEEAWRVLITDATALDGTSTLQRRPDFTVVEMKVGTDLYFEEHDNRSSGAVIYRMRVLEASASRVVIETENMSAVRAFILTLFPPGSLRAVYFVERQSPGNWNFYGIQSVGEDASALSTVSLASYGNRLAALYSHFTGTTAYGDLDPHRE